MKLFTFDIADDRGAGWFRLGSNGPGLHFTTRKPLFSERNGLRLPFMVLGRYRFFGLPRWHA